MRSGKRGLLTCCITSCIPPPARQTHTPRPPPLPNRSWFYQKALGTLSSWSALRAALLAARPSTWGALTLLMVGSFVRSVVEQFAQVGGGVGGTVGGWVGGWAQMVVATLSAFPFPSAHTHSIPIPPSPPFTVVCGGGRQAAATGGSRPAHKAAVAGRRDGRVVGGRGAAAQRHASRLLCPGGSFYAARCSTHFVLLPCPARPVLSAGLPSPLLHPLIHSLGQIL